MAFRDDGLEAAHDGGMEMERAACAELVRAAGCQCKVLPGAIWGPEPGHPCIWCKHTETEHGPPGDGGAPHPEWRACPSNATSSYYSSSGPHGLRQHAPACPEALADAIEGRGW